MFSQLLRQLCRVCGTSPSFVEGHRLTTKLFTSMIFVQANKLFKLHFHFKNRHDHNKLHTEKIKVFLLP